MHIQCPHCHNALNIVDAQPAVDAMCPSCGSKFPVGDVTVTYRDTVVDRVGHFEIIEKVGAGHFGTVFRARDAQLNRTVAIKLPRSSEITEQHRAMFLREARAAAGLDHPNIVRVYEIGEEEPDQIYIVSQFVDGVTLRDKLQIHRFPPTEAAEFLAVVAEAIHFAHENGVVHRDLKPSNILVDHEGHPHISDFGLAKLDNAEVTVTLSGVVLGTPAYMSPEQASGDSHSAGPRSDVYSLGVILYEMLTGQRPFDGSTTLLLHQIQSSDPRAPRSINDTIPRDLETICLKALAKSPEKRYATAQDMADDLKRFVVGESIVARRTSRVERTWRWTIRHRALSTAMTIAAAASILAVTLALKPSGPNVPPGSELTITERLRVRLSTNPEGAQLYFHPIDPKTGLPNPEKTVHDPTQRSPAVVNLLPGDYLVVAVLDDGRFHEVYRHVPRSHDAIPSQYPHRIWTKRKDGNLGLLDIQIPDTNVADGMVLIEGSPEFLVGLPNSTVVPQHTRRIAPFSLDTHEVTVDEFRRKNRGQLPIVQIGKKVDHPGDFPVTDLLFDEALMYAEKSGKRLMTEFEYEFAATQGGRSLFPSGDEAPPETSWQLGPVGQSTFDRSPTVPVALNLFSNASELTLSRFVPYPSSGAAGFEIPGTSGEGYLVVRGGSQNSDGALENTKQGPRWRLPLGIKSTSPIVGFRCVRSKNPRLTTEDF